MAQILAAIKARAAAIYSGAAASAIKRSGIAINKFQALAIILDSSLAG